MKYLILMLLFLTACTSNGVTEQEFEATVNDCVELCNIDNKAIWGLECARIFTYGKQEFEGLLNNCAAYKGIEVERTEAEILVEECVKCFAEDYYDNDNVRAIHSRNCWYKFRSIEDMKYIIEDCKSKQHKISH